MIELVPAFFAASAVVVSAAGASVGALSKAALLRLFRLKSHGLPLALLVGLAVAETVIMSISLALAFILVEPFATPQPAGKTMFLVALLSLSAVFHIVFAWLPNLYLSGRIALASIGSPGTVADLVWAGVLASVTPCAVAFLALASWSYFFS